MLVLHRRHGEKIFIGENIVIQVVAISRGRVQIGIECPKEIPIRRDDLKSPTTRESKSKLS